MALTQEQYDKLLEKYCCDMVEGMDLDTLVHFAIDQIEENVRRNCSLDEELIEEISNYYDVFDVASMIEDVGANPTDFGFADVSDDCD
jgi:hypothetical protein